MAKKLSEQTKKSLKTELRPHANEGLIYAAVQWLRGNPCAYFPFAYRFLTRYTPSTKGPNIPCGSLRMSGVRETLKEKRRIPVFQSQLNNCFILPFVYYFIYRLLHNYCRLTFQMNEIQFKIICFKLRCFLFWVLRWVIHICMHFHYEPEVALCMSDCLVLIVSVYSIAPLNVHLQKDEDISLIVFFCYFSSAQKSLHV